MGFYAGIEELHLGPGSERIKKSTIVLRERIWYDAIYSGV